MKDKDYYECEKCHHLSSEGEVEHICLIGLSERLHKWCDLAWTEGWINKEEWHDETELHASIMKHLD